ncbi:MarR family winged helix-turn-helix transcriptional regulator [Paralcaligenes ginsengisoli]
MAHDKTSLSPAPSAAGKSAAHEAARGAAPASARAHAQSTFYSPNEESLCETNNVGHLIKNVYASINRNIDLGVAPLGLTAMQWKPLVLICHRDIHTPAELSRVTNVDTGAMTRTLDRLEAKGFLTRHRCLEDRRVVNLELTESGTKVVKDILPAVAHTLNAHLAGFSEKETETLLKFLRRMIDNGACMDSSLDQDAH